MTLTQPTIINLPKLNLNELITEISTKINCVDDRRGKERSSLGRRENQRFNIPWLTAKTQQNGCENGGVKGKRALKVN